MSQVTQNTFVRHNCAQTGGGGQRLVLGVGVDARRDRGIGVAEPFGDHGQRNPAQMQSCAAGMTSIMQPDGPHPGGLGEFASHVRHRPRRVGLSGFVDWVSVTGPLPTPCPQFAHSYR